MKTICVELNDKLAAELDNVVGKGLFQNEEEAIRFALIAFIENQRPELIERFQRDDIAWALDQRKSQQ